MTRPPALVLTAGLGTRLRPLTYLRAKAAVPVNGEPLARRVARWLAAHGIVEQVFNLHHHAASVTACLGDGADLGITLRYSWEPTILGSAGGPRHALPLLGAEGRPVLIVNGDTLTDVDLEGLLARHHASGALVTMALIPNPAPEKYGGVTLTADGYVAAFTRPGGAAASFHFIGVQAVDPRAFDRLPDGVPAESVNALYPALIQDSPHSVAAFVSEASFQDIGRPADCLATSLALAALEGDRLVAATASVAPSAVLERTALWDDVTVGAGARLVECIVADGAHVPAGLSLARCAVVPAGSRAPSCHERIERGLLIQPL